MADSVRPLRRAPPTPRTRGPEDADRAGDSPRRGWHRAWIPLYVLAFCGGVYFLQFAAPVLLPLVIAVLLFYALDPVVDFVERRRVPRLLASVLVVTAMVSGLCAGAYALWPQVDAVIAKVPEGTERLRSTLRRERRRSADSALERVQEAAKAIDSAAAEATRPAPQTPGVMRVELQQSLRVTDWLWSGGVSAIGIAGQAVTILLLTIFLLNEDDAFKRKILRRLRTWRSRRAAVRIFNDVASQMERFFWVQVLTSLIVACATMLALWWLGVEQFVVWGLFAGLLNNVPYYGPLVVTAVLAAVGFLQFGSVWEAALVGGVTLVITSLEGMLLTPYLLTRAASLSPAATFIAIAFWGWLWGVPGVFLAVPLLMVTKSVCDNIEPLKGLGDLLGE
jgi:predicted PurR-regulated permease PerM